MLKLIEADILSVVTGNIFQQVNCMGVMRSGLAKAIKEKYPVVEKEYTEYCARVADPLNLIGEVQKVQVTLELNIINVFGQYTYGQGSALLQRHTEYSALKQAFQKVLDGTALRSNNIVAFPYFFGSDRGGGDWSIVQTLIERYFPHAVIYKLPK